MRGSPPLHLVIFGVVFAALAVPLAQLTFSRAPAVQAPPPLQSAKTRTHIRFRYAHVPLQVSVQLNGRELASATYAQPKSASVEFESELIIPMEGLEFLVKVTWPAGTPDTAFAMELEPDGLETQAQTHWSTGATLEDVFTFQWKEQPQP
jgi:hypothetical protein